MLILIEFVLLQESYSNEDIKNERKDIYQDLLIWSLFANRQELATLFWVKCENQLRKDVFIF